MLPAAAHRPLALGALTAGTLLAELALTRVMSIAYFPHVAFLVLSTAMLGTGVAAALQSLRPLPEDPSELRFTATLAGVSGLAFVAGHGVVHTLGPEPLELARSPGAALALAAALLTLALPFALGGAAVIRLLAARREESFRMYAADLGGAAVGCLVAVPAMNMVGPRGALVLAAAATAGAAALLAAGSARRIWLGVTLAAAAFAPVATRTLPLHVSSAKVTRGGVPFDDVLRDEARTTATIETVHPRLDRVEFSPAVHRLMFDAGVAAVRIPVGPVGPPHDATLPVELRPDAPVLVMGAGAGWEVREAIAFGRGPVDAVEIHPRVVDFVPPSARGPRVRWHVEDGRTFLERPGPQYGAAIMIHTISNAAAATGALHLSESYLLTVEAARRFLERLEPHGLLLVTRPETQIARWVATLRRASGEARVEDRVVAWKERSQGPSFYGAVLFAKGGFRAEDLEQIRARVEARGLELLYDPGGSVAPRPDLAFALGLGEQPPGRNRLDPVRDDRPFFNQRIAFADLEPADFRRAFGAADRARMALEDTPLAETSAVVLLVEVSFIGLLTALAPFARRRSEASPRPRGAWLAHLAFYPALGLGFMLVEISLVQQLGLLLGSPTLTLAAALGGLLLGAGLGAALAGRGPATVRRLNAVAATVLFWAVLGPVGLYGALGWAFGLRLAVAVGVAFGIGVMLGQPFPIGLSESGRLGNRWAAWGFALNAVASVGATVLALILAAEVGFFAVQMVAAGAYVIARLAGEHLVPGARV